MAQPTFKLAAINGIDQLIFIHSFSFSHLPYFLKCVGLSDCSDSSSPDSINSTHTLGRGEPWEKLVSIWKLSLGRNHRFSLKNGALSRGARAGRSVHADVIAPSALATALVRAAALRGRERGQLRANGPLRIAQVGRKNRLGFAKLRSFWTPSHNDSSSAPPIPLSVTAPAGNLSTENFRWRLGHDDACGQLA
jgi:hypothetical protein